MCRVESIGKQIDARNRSGAHRTATPGVGKPSLQAAAFRWIAPLPGRRRGATSTVTWEHRQSFGMCRDRVARKARGLDKTTPTKPSP